VKDSCAGRCGKFTAGAKCQCDGTCKTYKDCCNDYDTLCSTPGCKTDKDCDDKLICTTDKCEKAADGQMKCTNAILTGTCLVDGNCYSDGDFGPSNCLVCDSKDNNEGFKAAAGSKCDDGASCTTGDACNAAGECVGTPSGPDCCVKDSDCGGGDACKTGTCEAGKCKVTAKPKCCSSGACCDLVANQPKAANSKCADDVLKTEYKCNGKEVQKRTAFAGCNGVATGLCSKIEKFWAWSDWQTVLTCSGTQACKIGGDGIGACSGGGDKCTKDTDCNDGNSCTKDTCSGTCSHTLVSGCCNFDSDCDDGNKCTSDLCDNHQCKSETIPCKGAADCEIASCDPKTGACNAKVKPGFCKILDGCYKDGQVDATNKCLACSGSKPDAWSTSKSCQCTSGACCNPVLKKIKLAKTKCHDQVKATEYMCSADGSKVLTRSAFRGCTGKSNTCSTSKTNYHWTTWTTFKACSSAQKCEVASSSQPGVCKSTNTTKCIAGAKCCTSAGQFDKKGTKCGDFWLSSEYKCSATGQDVMRRKAFPGCSGTSTLCSTATENRAWGKWESYKSCKGGTVCKVTNPNQAGYCTSDKQCSPGSTCCTDKGTWAPQKTKCGSSPFKREYSCSSTAKGAKVLVKEAFGGCTGGSSSCSYSGLNLHWTVAKTYKQCSSAQVCSVSNPSLPGSCKDTGGSLCGKNDPYESGTSSTKSYSLGSFNDNSAGKILNPSVHFKSESDKDYFKYKIVDSAAGYSPKVHIEWNANSNVSVCAYYGCDAGGSGNKCISVTCPSGFSTSSTSAASDTKPNGCCVTNPSSKGVLSWLPKINNANKGGWVHFNIKNKAPVCQEVSVKLEFGQKDQSLCKPGSTCCTGAGSFAPKGAKCDSKKQKSEYKCSSSAKGGDVLVHEAYRGCIGSSAYCAYGASYFHWTAWKTYANCGTSQVCSVTSSSSPGKCVGASDAVCTKYDKYESGSTSTINAYNLGSYKETDSAKLLAPKVHFKSKYDSDTFKYRIDDVLNLFWHPSAHVEFSAADSVELCVWYRCVKASDGKSCNPVKCPAGTSASYNGLVSSKNPNGCCITANSGKVRFKPDNPNGTDEEGDVYFRMTNKGNVCQEVTTRLVFGDQTKTQCTPNTTCCSASGTYASKATKCGSLAKKTEYKCSSKSKGGDVLRRQAFQGCTGSSTTCSTSSSNYAWSGWSTYKNCTSSQLCKVTSTTSPGTCTTATDPLCNKTDKYESGTFITNAYNLGTFNDTSNAIQLYPKVHFKSANDNDYFKYIINDLTNVTDPRVHVEWTGAAPVKVCAYYRCDKVTGGACKPVKCPSGSTPSQFFSVSSTNPNGCCKTATKGTIQYVPDASGINETGWAFLRMANEAAICQEVSVKLIFGSKSKTQCTPGSTCCTQSGTYASKATKCSSSLQKSEYKCSSSAAGGDVLVRKAYRGCTGSSTTCSVSSSNYNWSGWTTYKNCSSSQICSISSLNTPGTCKATGSSAAVCKATDKYESGWSAFSAVKVGDFNDNAKAFVLNPDAHFKNAYDTDYIKYSIKDLTNFSDPRVQVEATASEDVEICGYYACNQGKNGKECAKVKCTNGTPSYYSSVSAVNPNGCCATGKKPKIYFKPDTPGKTNEDGWAFVRFRNKSKICQYVNAKLVFAGSSKVCGDGICGSGESTSCKGDCGSCAGLCGKFKAGAKCQCDALCKSKGDCCWDRNLYCE